MDLLVELSKQLSPERYKHTLGVRDTAIELARTWQADLKKAELAALLHDWAKVYSDQQLLAIAEQKALSIGEFDKLTPQVLHGPIGAVLVKEKFKLEDEEVLSAIACHTLGKENMTLLDKIIFLADMIEPNRDYPGVFKLREKAKRSLDEALLLGYDSTITFFIKNRQILHPQTVKSRNSLLQSLPALAGT